MLRLGDRVGREGLIGEDAFEQAVETVRRFRSIAEAEGATEIVALGTAALREALDAFLEKTQEIMTGYITVNL